MVLDIATTSATIKAIASVAKGAGNIQLYNDIITLQGTILEQQAAAVALLEENATLRRELAELRERQRRRSEMRFEDNVYWRGDSGQKREGPFCPKCLDGSEKDVPLADRRDDHWWRCAVCASIFEKPGPAQGHNAVEDYDPHRRFR